MPYKVDFGARGDLIIEGVCRLLLRGGAAALSLRGVAAEIEMSASSILHQFGDRARLLTVAASRTGAKRLHDIEWYAVRSGPEAFLPADQEQLDRDRVWLAFLELARSEEAMGPVVAHLRQEQWRILALATGLDDAPAELFVPGLVAPPELVAPELIGLGAMVDGLVAAMVTGAPPLPVDDARRALGGCLRSMGLARESR